MKHLALIFPLLFSACGEAKNDAHIKWEQLDAKQLEAVCGNAYRDGCVMRDHTGCTMYTLPVPLSEFTGYNSDMNSPRWRAFAHEALHCFEYEHQ